MNNISVIIPVRNMATTIERAIDSAVKIGCLDVVVADDNSDDGSGRIAANYPSDFVSTLFTMKGSVPIGVSGARNRAIQHAQCDWILPLDADDELLPDAFYILRQHLRPGTFVYTGYTDDVGDHWPPRIDLITRKNVAHATFLFHREDWLRVGGYSPEFFLGEDWAFMLALLNAGVRPVRVDEPIYKRGGTNERTARARKYWPTIMALAKERYPAVFEDVLHAIPTHP